MINNKSKKNEEDRSMLTRLLKDILKKPLTMADFWS